MLSKAKIILDSRNSYGERFLTAELTFRRTVLEEFNTHRAFARNGASNRAIPTEKLVKTVEEVNVVPSYLGKYQKGMEASEEMSKEEQEGFLQDREKLRKMAIEIARKWAGVAQKELVNDLLVPFQMQTMVVSGTENAFLHFLKLRNHPKAKPDLREVAELLETALGESCPVHRHHHLPYVTDVDDTLPIESSFWYYLKMSASRCARVTYLNQNIKKTVEEEIDFFNRLVNAVPPHASPLEHVVVEYEYKAENSITQGTHWHTFRQILGV